MPIKIAMRKKAKNLFIVKEKTLAEISELTSISARTIANWSSKEGWMAGRAEHRKACDRIEANIFKLYESMTEKASKSLDPQDIMAVLQLGKTLKEKGEID
jgi:uncharacterized protein YjcR